jgi:hypothetical protein
MARKLINVGLSANDGKGDSLRDSAIKCNDNFSELYTAVANVAGYSLPIASGSILGGIKVGSNLSINSAGVLSASRPTSLTDLNINDGTNGQYLKTDGHGNFSFASLPSQISNLNDLGDVVLNAPTANQYLKYDGTNWVNTTLALTTSLSGLTDVTLTTPTSGQVLKYNGSKWINGTSNPFDQNLNKTDQVDFVTTTADEFILGGSGTPTVHSDTELFLSATSRITVITKTPFKLANVTTTERNALTAVNGDMIYNTSTNKFQGYAGGTWVDLH